MRIHRPDVPLGAYQGIPDFLPLGPDTDPLAVLTKVTLLGVDRDATAASIAAQQTVRAAHPDLASEWDKWLVWCRGWQEDVTRRCNDKTRFFGPNDDASIESSEFEYVRQALKDYKLRWAKAGASGMGFPNVPVEPPQVPPVLPPVMPPPQERPVEPQPAEQTNTTLVVALLGLAVVAFFVARGDGR